MYKANPDTPNAYDIPGNAHHHPAADYKGAAFRTFAPTFGYPLGAARGRHTHDVGSGEPWVG